MTYLEKLRKEYTAYERETDESIIRDLCPKMFFRYARYPKLCKQHSTFAEPFSIELCRKCWNSEAEE